MNLFFKNTIRIKSVFKKVLGSKLLFFLMISVVFIELVAFFGLDRSLHLYFLDVGQGDSILVKTPNYRYVLVDGGEDPLVLEELGEILPFWERKIDVVIGTHADSDHIGGLVFVLEKYEVDQFVMNDLDIMDNNLQKIKDIAEEKEIELHELGNEDEIDLGELHLDILWPDEGFEGENDNQNSIVLRGEYKKFTFFLTGDIEAEQEQIIASGFAPIQGVILKVSHHGSKTATSFEILNAVNPDFAIISCGEDNKFGHPAKEVIERIQQKNIEILRTDVHGRIEFVTDGEQFSKKLEK